MFTCAGHIHVFIKKKNYEKDLISLLEMIKDTTMPQWLMNLLIYGPGTGLLGRYAG